MKALGAIAVLIAIVAAMVLPSYAGAGTLVVGFKKKSKRQARSAVVRKAGGSSIEHMRSVNAVRFAVSRKREKATLKKLRRNKIVRYARRDGRVKAEVSPNDPDIATQWALAKINAFSAWDTTMGAPSVKVAIVDTGVDYNHPELQGQVLPGRDFVDEDSDAMDVDGHGTHVAGIVAAHANNGAGVAGLAPGVRILPVRVLGADGGGYLSDVARGIIYAADNGAQVINLSLGGGSGDKVIEDAVNYAAGRGAVVLCATGNDGESGPSYPAQYDNCVAVGSTDSADRISNFSNFGPYVDVAAPGSAILSTVMGGGYDSWNGTSMATPYAAATAALLASQGRARPNIISSLTKSSVDLGPSGRDSRFGWGRIDVAAALAQPVVTAPPPPTQTPTTPAPAPGVTPSPVPIVNQTPQENRTPWCESAGVQKIYSSKRIAIPLDCGDENVGDILTLSAVTISGEPAEGTLTFNQRSRTAHYTPPLRDSSRTVRDSFWVEVSDGKSAYASRSLLSITLAAQDNSWLRRTGRNGELLKCGLTPGDACALPQGGAFFYRGHSSIVTFQPDARYVLEGFRKGSGWKRMLRRTSEGKQSSTNGSHSGIIDSTSLKAGTWKFQMTFSAGPTTGQSNALYVTIK